MDDVALGVKIFKRAGQLEKLLESVKDTEISKVYIADDGEQTDRKERIYGTEYPFEMTIFDLEYDAGLGYGRHKIVNHLQEDYLLIADTDHRIPRNVKSLRLQLEQLPEIGGISGLLFENGTITAACHDLYENDRIIIRDIQEPKEVEMIAGAPLVNYDFLPNVAMFRKECLRDYCWDPEYVIGKEHLDFYIGHMKQTDWSFGVNPNVLFEHYPNSGGDDYKKNRQNLNKLKHSKHYFLNKWGYRQIILGQTSWIGPSSTHPRSKTQISHNILKTALLNLPPSVQETLMNLRDKRRAQKGRGPL